VPLFGDLGLVNQILASRSIFLSLEFLFHPLFHTPPSPSSQGASSNLCARPLNVYQSDYKQLNRKEDFPDSW
jgi:hypothetical protein